MHFATFSRQTREASRWLEEKNLSAEITMILNRESRRTWRLVDTHLHGHVESAADRCVPINSLVTLPRKTHEVHRSSGTYVRTYVTSICSAFARIRMRSSTVYPVRSALRYWIRFSTAVRFVAPHNHTPQSARRDTFSLLAHTQRRTLSFHGWHRIVPANCPESRPDWTPRSSRIRCHEFPYDGSTFQFWHETRRIYRVNSRFFLGIYLQ